MERGDIKKRDEEATMMRMNAKEFCRWNKQGSGDGVQVVSSVFREKYNDITHKLLLSFLLLLEKNDLDV